MNCTARSVTDPMGMDMETLVHTQFQRWEDERYQHRQQLKQNHKDDYYNKPRDVRGFPILLCVDVARP